MDGVGLPVADAAKRLLDGDPILGPVAILEAAAIVFLVACIVWLIRSGKADMAAKDRKLEEAYAKQVQIMADVIPAIRDMKDVATDVLIHGASGRSTRRVP